MYFTSKDRAALKASQKVYVENFSEEYEKPLTEDEVEEYSDINYSSKTINPEYIAKYSSEKIAEDEVLEDGEYFDKSYNQYSNSEVPENYYVNNNYYGTSPYSNYNPYSVWNSDPWGYGSPYGYSPYSYGSRISLTFSYGWGNIAITVAVIMVMVIMTLGDMVMEIPIAITTIMV
jgi:hypothetical protein